MKSESESRRLLNNLVLDTLEVMRPPPRLTVSSWADENRRLSSEGSAEPGFWRTDRAPYQREPMDCFNETGVDLIVLKWASQVGKSEILLNALGYFSDQDPAPILLIEPSLETGEAFSKDRIAPMIRDTPALSHKFPAPGSKGSGNTLRHKIFPGGHLTIAGANSAAGLAMRPIRVVLCDEVDRYPASAGTEGDPVSLAFKRSDTFWNRVRAMVSSPGKEGLSRIDAAYQKSDQRQYLVPCPHCDHAHALEFQNCKWDTNEDGEPSRDVWFACPDCGGVIEEKHKSAMLRRGRWQAQKQFRGTAGFHLNAFYSPWKTWRELRDEFLDRKDSPSRLQTFVNTVLAETWKGEEEEAADADVLAARREPYFGPTDDTIVLTASVDVQDDRLEVEVLGWGFDLESWGVEYRVLEGDPAKDEIWKRLDDLLAESWSRPDGVDLHILGMGIDSGGHHTDQVYKYAKKNPGRVFALKGMGGQGKPIVSKPSRNNKARIPLYTVGVDMVKELLFYSMLNTTEPGPLYCHFPGDSAAGYDETYFKQLTSERPAVRHRMGVPVRVWVVKGRNEGLDCRVYNIATINILKPNFKAIAARLGETEDPPPKAPQPQARKSGPWVNKRKTWMNRR